MIVICPHASLAGVGAERRPSHLVLLSSPGRPVPEPPPGPALLRLVFHDIAAERPPLVAPDRAAIDALIAFGREWRGERPLVCSCEMGVSRSTAAAFILLCDRCPDLPEADIARALRRAAPSATPNPLMAALADALLARDGRMADAVAAIGRGADYRPFLSVELPLPEPVTPTASA